jgi:hypothetical protein
LGLLACGEREEVSQKGQKMRTKYSTILQRSFFTSANSFKKVAVVLKERIIIH